MNIKQLCLFIFAVCVGSATASAASFEDLWRQHGGQILKPESQKTSSPPRIQILSLTIDADQFNLRASVSEPEKVTLCELNNQPVDLRDGFFNQRGYIPPDGLDLQLECQTFDGSTLSMTRTLQRTKKLVTEQKIIKSLNPTQTRGAINKDAYALIIGIENYKKTSIKAEFANRDAEIFGDFAHYSLGVPRKNIKVLVNEKADKGEIVFTAKYWLGNSVKKTSDVYIFFAGHGLASPDGDQSFIIPVDGRPGVLKETAIDKDMLFNEIAKLGAATYTIFLDTCYSGVSRDKEALSSARPLGIKALKKSHPENFMIFSAAGAMQTALPLKEARHGLFSYYLMLGLQGEADLNADRKIVASELHEYVLDRVNKSSGFEQTPELQGDADRVLVRFQ